MSEPTTVNVALIIPNTGDLPGTWGSNALNPDFNSIDGFLGGVQTISASNANIVLTAPAGSITPSGGPTQAQNCVLRFTGTLTGNVQVTLPLPGYMIIENLTTGNFLLTFAAASSGNIIAVDQGMRQHIYNDGTNVWFINLGEVGKMEFWAGLSALPAWVTTCTIAPYLLCDGTSTFTFSKYPFLGKRMGSAFGGNGITTFGVPDMQGRVPLAYDGTGTRITTAGSGINGQTIGAAGGIQAQSLIANQVPTIAGSNPSAVLLGVTINEPTVSGSLQSGTNGSPFNTIAVTPTGIAITVNAGAIPFTSTNTGGSSPSHPNVQPSQVVGIWVIKS